MQDQLAFFEAAPAFPPGVRYQPDIISVAEERTVLERVRALPFREFEFQGYVGK